MKALATLRLWGITIHQAKAAARLGSAQALGRMESESPSDDEHIHSRACMRNLLLAVLFVIALAGCSFATTANLAGTIPRAQQVTIYVPDSFIAAVDSKELGKTAPGDEPTVVQLLTVQPGTHMYRARLQVEDPAVMGSVFRWWKFRFRFNSEPGHTYYLWFERTGQENPRVYGRDLGLNVPVASLPVAPAFGLRSTAELAAEKQARLALREKGTPIEIELLPLE